MRIVTLNAKMLREYRADQEMLHKAKRPCALLLNLKYKGKRYTFAVPMRSNISPTTPKDQFFPLPPRPNTKDRHFHGVHYIKMFPVKRSFTHPFRVSDNSSATLMKRILDENEDLIIADCQRYLKRYQTGKRPNYSTDIDLLIEIMNRRNNV